MTPTAASPPTAKGRFCVLVSKTALARAKALAAQGPTSATSASPMRMAQRGMVRAAKVKALAAARATVAARKVERERVSIDYLFPKLALCQHRL